MILPASDAALLVIDMQNGFVHAESGMGKSVSGTQAQRAIVPAILSLVEFCRSKKSPCSGASRNIFRAMSRASENASPPILRGRVFFPAYAALGKPSSLRACGWP